jgi:hypothetical protein
LADGVSFPGTKASGIWVSDLESYPSGENVGAFAGDLTRRFPLIIKALARLRSRSCILDGEAVACDDNGIASFDRIRCFYRPHSINAQRAGSFAGSSWMVAPSPAIYAEHCTATGHHAAPFKSSACWPIDHTAPQGVSNAETLIAAG